MSFFHKSTRARIVSLRWVIPPLVICMASVLQGCDHQAAPSPKPNPHPQKTLKLSIIIENSAVNRVEARSAWTVGDLGCAPVMFPSGAERVEQFEVLERVEKIGDEYVATVVEDRFLPDKCKWVNGGVDLNYMHDGTLLAGDAINRDVLQGRRVHMSTCVPPPHDPPICFPREHELFLRNHFNGTFNVTVKLMR